MQLRVLLPTHVLVDESVNKVTAEAQNGSFCLLPLHIDFTAALTPGLLSFEHLDGSEEFIAIAEGVLVKKGDAVQVSTINAVRGADLGTLKSAVSAQFRDLDERDRRARTALTRLEADFVRRFIELREIN